MTIESDIILTRSQEILINKLKKWFFSKSKPYFSYSGGPGTGKTTVIRVFVDEIGLTYDEFITAAYVGKAVLLLLRKGLRASTIHSLIYNVFFDLEKSNNMYDPPKRVLKFGLKDRLSETLKLIIIDEATMVNDKMKDEILSFGIPVVFTGDINQLPPVFGISSVMQNPDFILTELMRQAEDDPIVIIANRILNGQPLYTGTYGLSKIIDHHNIDRTLIDNYDMIICAKNKTRELINTQIRENILGRQNKLPVVGDKIICRQNNWSLSLDEIYLTNGLIGFIEYIDKSFMHKGCVNIDFRPDFMDRSFENVELDAKYIKLDYEDRASYGISRFNKFEYGYAITSHLCIPKDTLIYTEDGIKELYKLENYSGKVFNGKYWETPSKYIDNGIDKVNILTLSNNTEYSVTDYHKCKVLTDNGVTTVHGKDVVIGDEFLLRFGQELYQNQEYVFDYVERKYKLGTNLYGLPDKLSDGLSLLIGMICADGTITKGSVRYSKQHLECVETFALYMKDIFKYDAPITRSKYEDQWCYEINSVQIRDFFYHMKGLRPNKKYVPDCIMEGSISNQYSFLRGLFEDGCVHLKVKKFDMVALTFKNNKMINQLNVMLSNIGISPSFAKVVKGDSVLNNLYIFKEDAYIFRDKIGFITHDKQERLESINFEYSNRGSKVLAKIVLKNYNFGSNRSVNNLRRGGVLTHEAFLKIYRSIPDSHRQSDWVIFIKEIFENFRVITVNTIQEGYADTACLEMPESHEFLQNGLLGGNSQGSEYDNVLFINEKIWNKELTKKMAYTAVTRAKKSITIVNSF